MKKRAQNLEKDYFDDYYTQHPQAFEYNPALLRQAEIYFAKMFKILRPKKNDSVLSLGCANGRFDLRLAPLVNKIIGIDISSKAIANARKTGQKLKIKNAHFYARDITQGLSYKNNSFNIVLALGIFHHLKLRQIKPLIKEIHRVLRPGGQLYTIDPSATGILRIIARNFFKKLYQSYRSPEEHDLDYRWLIRICQKSGFKLKKLEFLDLCSSETIYLWPDIPGFILKLLETIDKYWCQLPIIKYSSSQFSLTCKKQ